MHTKDHLPPPSPLPPPPHTLGKLRISESEMCQCNAGIMNVANYTMF